MTTPRYQWPAASYPDQDLPDLEDRFTAQDHGVILWVPLDYLHADQPGHGYWQFASPAGYRATDTDEPKITLGGPDLHVVELAGSAAHLINRTLPHLTAVLHTVTTTQGGQSSSAPFPAYIVH